MKDKFYYVLDGESIEYIIEEPLDEDIFVLRRSDSDNWSSHARGEKILTALNSGSGYKIKWEEKVDKTLDYSQVMELTIMLNFLNRHNSSNPMEYRIVPGESVSPLV